MSTRALITLALAVSLSACGSDKKPEYQYDDLLRLNHIQAKGTHNSYHIARPDGTPSRCNPLTAPRFCTPRSIENPTIVNW